MIRTCLLLLAGFFAPQLISFDANSDLFSAALVAFAATIFAPLLRPALWVMAGAALFVAAALTVVATRVAPELVGDSIVVDVVIADFPRRRGSTTTFIASPQDDDRLPRRIRISWYQCPVELRIGDRWQFELRLRRPRGTSNPGAFDVEAWLLRESVGATGYVVKGPRNHLLRSGPSTRLETVRHDFVDRVTTATKDREQAAVLAALVVGARHMLSDAQWQRYARTGTSHLMAISGLHIGLAASGGYLLACAILGGLRVAGNQHLLAVGIALLVALGYASVSGWAIPARRSVLMLTLAAAACLRRRRPLPVRIVASVCVAVAIVEPLTTMAPGFVLSFGAVAALLWVARRRSPQTSRPKSLRLRLVTWVQDLGALQVTLLFALMPFTALLFGKIALAAPAVNLLAVPLFSLITVPLALLGFVLTGPMAIIGDICLIGAAQTVGMLEAVLRGVAAIRATAYAVPEISGVAWLFLLLPVIWVILPGAWPCRHVCWLAAFALLTYIPSSPVVGCVELRILDVGQGLAVLARTRSSSLLYDTGPAYFSGGDAAERLVVPLLLRLRIQQLDYFVVSHGDSDHAGGVQTVLDALHVRVLLVGEKLDDIDRRQQRCDSNQSWEIDGIGFRILHPVAGSSLEGNDASCVLEISAGERRVLITGDIEQLAEKRLLDRGQLRTVDVITVPHHGSQTSSTPAFVAVLKPSLAVVANGFGNRWGLPKAEIVARWRRGGAQVLETADSGAIRVRICAKSKEVDVRRHRAVRHRIWHD